ncbi:MAG: ribosome biogenesis GTPase YlqF [Lachnospiraceae bacterium]|nr:ribosome biogenesis GTPase YlqF [Lachnospiraceae bacterium]
MLVTWYPGHMTKAKRMMQENIRLIDLIIELLDARIPMSSRNPDIDTLGNGKGRLVVLNKADLADPAVTQEWIRYFEDLGIIAVTINARERNGFSLIQGAIQKACAEKIERDRKRGILNRPVRAMVAGIPNVGKSTFINTLAGKACAKTGNKPGVTKGKQWIRLNKNVELLDTPGLLWPKFDDEETGMHLAMIGSINDEILQKEELSVELIDRIRRISPEAIGKRYGIDENGTGYEVLGRIAQARGCLRKGNEPDPEKAAGIVLEEFRSGKIGRISLEAPKE